MIFDIYYNIRQEQFPYVKTKDNDKYNYLPKNKSLCETIGCSF